MYFKFKETVLKALKDDDRYFQHLVKIFLTVQSKSIIFYF